MSRIGKKPISIPNEVETAIDGRTVSVKGPKGHLSLSTHHLVKASIEEIGGKKCVVVSVEDGRDVKQRALWGLTARLISNIIKGAAQGYEKKLEINGVGFKAAVSGDKLKLEVGFSHPVEYTLPQGISASVDKNIITLSGADKHLVGEVAAQIRNIKKPEPYKGKGIKYIDEAIRRKAGKAVKAAA
jgi:large subunit ribosomal protein L6